MKKLFAMILALTLALTFAACGGEEEAGGSAAANPADVKGEVFDAGAVKALIPEGWAVYPVNDMWSDEANATDPDQMQIVKGGTSEFDILTKPMIQITHYEPGSMLNPSSSLYDGAETLEAFTTGELKWEGFSAKDLLDNSMIIIWTTDAAGHGYQVSMTPETDNGSFQLTDADVVAILQSIAPSK